MKTQRGNERKSSSWNVRDINGVECFHAYNMIHQFRRHSHKGYTIGVIEDGFGDNNYRGSVFHLSPGKIVVMNPEETHTGKVVSKHPWSYRMFYIDQETFKCMLPQNASLPFFHGLCFEDRYWFNKLRTLHFLLEQKGDALEMQTQFIECLSSFSQTFGNASPLAVPGDEPKAVGVIKDYINVHHQQNISTNDFDLKIPSHKPPVQLESSLPIVF